MPRNMNTKLSRRALLEDAGSAIRRGTPLEQEASGALLTREQSQAIIERAVALSSADEIQVSVDTSYSGNVRFAANQVVLGLGITRETLGVVATLPGAGAVHLWHATFLPITWCVQR